MKKLVLAVFGLVLMTSVAEAARRPHVVILKPIPPVPTQPTATVPLIVVPPVAMVVDLALRTSCDPMVIAFGRGPGFDPKGPITGNFLLPAIYTRCGYATPKWLLPALPKSASK